jgi:hypothetical protein
VGESHELAPFPTGLDLLALEAALRDLTETAMEQVITSHREAGERYFSLRLVGVLFTFLGALLLAGSCLLLAFGIYTLQSGSTGPPPLETAPLAAHSVRFLRTLGRIGGEWWVLWSLALFMSSLQSVAIGALIRLVIHLEENTRVSAQCLEKLRMRTEPADPMFRS